MFHPLASREYYRTEGFEELVFHLASALSYREASKVLNRFRRQTEVGTPMRTLASMVENEGSNMQKELNDLAERVFTEHQFDSEGKPEMAEKTYGLASSEGGLPLQAIAKAVSEYNRDKADHLKIDTAATDQFYEDPRVTVNV